MFDRGETRGHVSTIVLAPMAAEQVRASAGQHISQPPPGTKALSFLTNQLFRVDKKEMDNITCRDYPDIPRSLRHASVCFMGSSQ